jgi:putative hydrolase of the HAD superfamily
LSIKAITFDFWATLYKTRTIDYNKRVLQLKTSVEQYSGHTFAPEQFEAAVKVARETWSRTWIEQHRTITAADWLEVLLNELDISLTPPHFAEIEAKLENSVLEDLPSPVPEAKTVLPHLAKRYKLAIISDTGLTPGRILHQILEQDDLAGYFTHFTFSNEVGCSKPHAQAFLTTLKALGIEPQEAVHVGDLLRTDIAGAQAIGMRAVQYIGVNVDKGVAALGEIITPDVVIKSHTELTSWLEQLNEASSDK